MVEISPKTNLLEEKDYKYSLQDIADPNLYRDIYNYRNSRHFIQTVKEARKYDESNDEK